MANIHPDEMPVEASRLNGLTSAAGRQEGQPGSAGGQERQQGSFDRSDGLTSAAGRQEGQPDSFGSLRGQTAVVTGGGRGIGRAICLELARAGAHVVIGYGHNRQEAEETADACRRLGPDARIVEADVSDPASSKRLIDEAFKIHGRLDILVNNAGITKDTLALTMKMEDFDRVLKVNLYGAFSCSQAAAKYMLRARYGRIISISSIVGLHGNAGQTNYAASKAGIIGMTKSLAKELASRSITVNAVAPGMIDTQMTEAMSGMAQSVMKAQIPAGYAGRPEDVAAAVHFLALPQAGYITGQVLGVDGGMGA